MITVIAFPGYRDPYYRVDPKTREPDDVRSQDDEQKLLAYRGWLMARAKDFDEGRWGQVQDAMAGPVCTGLKALQLEGKPADRLFAPFAPDVHMEARSEILQRYAKRFMAPDATVRLVRLESLGDPIPAHRYDTTFSALRKVLPPIVEKLEGEVVGLVGPGTPAMNVALAVILGWFPQKAKLAQVFTPQFSGKAELAWLTMDGEYEPDLRDHRPEIETLRARLADLELSDMAGEPAQTDGGSLAGAIERYERAIWIQAVQRARAASKGRTPTYTEVGAIMGCSRQNATKRLKGLGLSHLLKA